MQAIRSAGIVPDIKEHMSFNRCLWTAEALRHELAVMGWIDWLIIAPPLIVTEANLQEGVVGLD